MGADGRLRGDEQPQALMLFQRRRMSVHKSPLSLTPQSVTMSSAWPHRSPPPPILRSPAREERRPAHAVVGVDRHDRRALGLEYDQALTRRPHRTKPWTLGHR